MLLVIDLNKGVGKKGKPIKGQWDEGKGAYTYDTQHQRVQSGGAHGSIAFNEEGGKEVPRSLRMSPYMHIKNKQSYRTDEFGNVVSSDRAYRRAQEEGAGSPTGSSYEKLSQLQKIAAQGDKPKPRKKAKEKDVSMKQYKMLIKKEKSGKLTENESRALAKQRFNVAQKTMAETNKSLVVLL